MITDALLEIIGAFPECIKREILQIEKSFCNFESRLSEIRIRAGRICTLTVDASTIPLNANVGAGEIAAFVQKMCKESVYAYADALADGYITTDGGFRIGIAGRAVINGKAVTGVRDITSVSVRIPHAVCGAGDAIVSAWQRCGQGILVYSPPGVGKTTALRDAAVQLSSDTHARRVAIVDSRGEFPCALIPRKCAVDILTGYPKAKGIEIATRTLSPDIIICDEIGDSEEAEAILSVQSAGVALIASAHAASYGELMARKTIRLLSSNGIFGAYVGVKRDKARHTYTTRFTDGCPDEGAAEKSGHDAPALEVGI